MCPFSLSNLPKIARKAFDYMAKEEVDSMNNCWVNSAGYFTGHVGREMADLLQYQEMCSRMKHDEPTARNQEMSVSHMVKF